MNLLPSFARTILTLTRSPSRTLVRTMATINMPRDPCTVSNYNNWRTKHTIADLVIDFKKQRLSGSVTLQLESTTEKESDEIILDTNALEITDISVNGSKSKDWVVKDRFEPYGFPLSVKVPKTTKGAVVDVKITLSTTDKCTSLQWLPPAQTSNKKFPYMFSQSQAIHNRSIFPPLDSSIHPSATHSKPNHTLTSNPNLVQKNESPPPHPS